MKTYYIRTRGAWCVKRYEIRAHDITDARNTAAALAWADGSRYADIWSTNGAHLSTIQAGENGRCYILVYTPDKMREMLTAEMRAAWGEVDA